MNSSNTKEQSSKLNAPPTSSSASRPHPKLDKFIALVAVGISSWKQAGEMLAKMYEQDETVLKQITDKCNWLTTDGLMTLIRIGRGQVRPEVLLMRPAVQEAMVRLPYAEQSRAIDGKVPVVTATGRVESKSAHQLTASDVRVAVGDNGFRPVSQQARYYTPSSPRTSSVQSVLIGNFKLILRAGKVVLEKTPASGGQRIWLRKDDNGELSATLEVSEIR